MDLKALRNSFDTLSDIVSGTLPSDTLLKGQRIQEIQTSIGPILPAIRWGRWLFLEKALEQATLCGDLLFSAVALRSLAEECIRLRWMDRVEQVNGVADSERIKGWAAAVAIGIEPMVGDHSASKRKGANLFEHRIDCPLDQSLVECMQALNDYVHPNYGSHIICIYPESSEGCLVILDAMETILEAFLNFGWAQAASQPIGTEISAPYFTNFKNVTWRFKTKVLPKAQQHARTVYNASGVDSDCLSSWAKSDSLLFREMLDTDEIRAALEPFSAALTAPNETLSGTTLPSRMLADDKPQSWKGAQAIFEFANLRRMETRLRSTYSCQPDFQSNIAAWASFVASSLELMTVATNFKIECFKAQLLRQIVDGNLIGIAICMRCILDHYAVSTWIQEKLHAHWDKLKNQVSSTGKISEKVAKDLLSDLNKLLSGTRATKEEVRSWSSASVSVNVTKAMENALDADDVFHKALRSEYDFSSASIHGRLMRSLELCFPNDRYTDNIVMRGVRLLDYFCDTGMEMQTNSKTMKLSVPLRHLSRMMSENQSLDAHEIKQVFGIVNKLKRGRDYTGSGNSADDPIVFDDKLQYHLAFIQYCDSENLDKSKRSLASVGSSLFDTVPSGLGVIWFKLNHLPLARE